MRISWFNAILATVISCLLAWWLWNMGSHPTQKWLLAAMGGGIIEIGLLIGMGVSFSNMHAGAKLKITMLSIATITFLACCIYSFFRFPPQAFAIPVGIYAGLSFLWSAYLYRSQK